MRFTARARAVTRIAIGSSIDSVVDAPLEKNEIATNAADQNEVAVPISLPSRTACSIFLRMIASA
ncbi:hypothetical protein IVB38_22055 [Bradyrhizobium sp. 38]|uniref:hypothetical protein n=1 Tax=unclassified Bradyrhizobium TaxID=2631580 RepID=UPI001FFAD2A5|nr:MULTISPECIES: hypothetical protein [unclassified Bradyrhizobium]MCK1338620.1 hypothetical protein [Bradyrhizobium sp. 38]MCK1776026.1 hypothetical protein [Bradyrhizobium sp. 132]